jgi:pimeloyl-ACP methyl ester carboxylesterase
MVTNLPDDAFAGSPDRRLAYRKYGNPAMLPLLAFHGWRDNAASFDRLAPLLLNHCVYAADFPGHGRSAPRSPQGNYEIWRYLDDVQLLFASLELEQADLLGHSMGGAVACLYAAVFPERVRKLVLLDSFGPLSTAPQDAPGQMRRSLLSEVPEPDIKRRYYNDREQAVQARARVGLSMSAASLLAERSLSQNGQGWYWHTDPRLKLPNRMSMSEAHVEAFLRGIRCPVLVISAPQFWTERKLDPLHRLAWISDCRHVTLPGHHHQHLDGQVEEVAALVAEFLGETNGSE